MSFVKKVFSGQREESVRILMKDENIRQRILFYGGKELGISNEISSGFALDQIMALSLQTDFAKDDEIVYVSSLIVKRIRDLNFLPYVGEQRGVELAEKCFISTCFFWDHLEERANRKSNPPPEFYSNIGREIFQQTGRYDVSVHMPNWQKYWGKILEKSVD